MPITIWNDSLATGIGQFDAHHKHLLDLLNTVYEDFVADAPAENIGRILEELMDYATYHFAAEEAWLQKVGYPRLAEHRLEHERYIRRVLEIQKDCLDGVGHLNIEVLSFLNNWLSDHILKVDAEYSVPDLP